MDPTREQWGAIADVVEQRGHMPFFDVAYQASSALTFCASAARLLLQMVEGLSIPVSDVSCMLSTAVAGLCALAVLPESL